MEKLHQLGLLFLNFGILNIVLSLIFSLISFTGKRYISSPHSKSRLFFLSLVAPLAISALTIFTSFAPPLFIKIPGKAMFCLNVPYCYIFSFVSPELPLFDGLLITAVGLALIPVIYLIVSIRYCITAYIYINKLANPSLIHPSSSLIKGDSGGLKLKVLKDFEDIYRIKVKVIDTQYILSFIWGYISNIIIISAGVIESLSIEELKCLLAHEISHFKRRDNLLKGLLLLCRNSLFIFPHVYYIFRWWREEIELIGDETAALITGRPLDVASALLKMRVSSFQENPPVPPFIKGGISDSPFAIGFSLNQTSSLLTGRVERLVAINDGKIRPGKERWHIIPSETGLLAGIALLFPICFIAISEFNPLLVHCFLEKLLLLF